MKTSDSMALPSEKKRIEELHRDSLNWISELDFIKDEIRFFKKLLRSYSFEPTTPNLFEKLQLFRQQMQEVLNRNMEDLDLVRKHENHLSGMQECDQLECDQAYLLEHDRLGEEIVGHLKKFKKLKKNIFEYTEGILKASRNK
ncbi:hypothetical protein ACFQ1M_16590 [Sungkyunkwania multivorans]|uniref:Uncharacterized protein n=1 Tax=Sungkyunkwania multivorans TaxID=1173618 RepID=A0ABW3D4A9_9FLAO